jgi:hypothetical protein
LRISDICIDKYASSWAHSKKPDRGNCPAKTIKKGGLVMREIARHTPGKIFIAVLLLDTLGYVFFLPLFLQGRTYLVFGWMPLAVFCYGVHTVIWTVSFWIYTSRYWAFR